jgi:hypothetical protein
MIETPFKVADDTYVIPSYAVAPGFGVLPVNAYLIQAQQPVLIDTGMQVDSDAFMSALRSLIDPSELRWIALSHEEKDHSGSIREVLEAAPQARLVTTWPAIGKMSAEWTVPVPRVRYLNPGETLSLGDRDLVAVAPIVFDAPSTTAYFDSKTSLYYAIDAFGAFVPSFSTVLGDLPQAEVMDGFGIFNRANHPWTVLVDQRKFDERIDRVRGLKPEGVLSSHLPPIPARRVGEMLDALQRIPSMGPYPLPDQAFLEKLIAQMAAGGAPPGR